ncbi:sister chromatid cohesion DCC1 [Micractinium conductrix]|uniref:Sister chromatid cohesion DCC1 n=1 Tax=Micractinium conductrix TaxID=554055 RepID=A0A2P6V3C9_9CHLO|nr:sister chromatid cohesion DCC1 [Micractinium conductrix]|eukprot:PSC68596.1 sister chromatid cohesion DCC1 [Micractinium conductrix]
MRLVALILAALALAGRGAAEAAPSLPVSGRVIVPDAFSLAAAEVVLALEGGGQRLAFPLADGSFSFAEVPLGVHTLTVELRELMFPGVRLDVGAARKGKVTAALFELPGAPEISHPLLLQPMARMEYFEQRQGFNVMGFIKTPYGIMAGFMLFSMFIMPKLKVDPEEYKEMMEEKDKAVAAVTGRGGNRQRSEMSASQLQLSTGQPRTLVWAEGIRKDVKLLEVDEDLLQELLADGLCLKGAPGEEAVLCSTSKTFAVKCVETTNMVLLVEDAAAAGGAAGHTPLRARDGNAVPQPTPVGQLTGLATQIEKNAAAAAVAPVLASALVSAHMELVVAAPRLHQMDALLAARQYGAEGQEGGGGDKGDAMQTDDGGGDGAGSFAGGYTEAELLEQVQCSTAELRAALLDRRALNLDGRWCTVDQAYQGLLLELALLTAVEHGWPLSALPGEALAAALQPHGYDPRVSLHCLASFGTRLGGGGGGDAIDDGPPSSQQQGGAASARADAAPMDADGAAAAGGAAAAAGGGGGGVYCLDEAAVCLHFARSLLAAQPDWILEEFETAWQLAVPEGMLPTLEMLHGEALLHGGGVGPSGVVAPLRIKHFPLAALPADAASRFAALFAERQRWEWEDLSPYVQSLRGPGQTAEALLLKYARISQQRPTDPVTYSAR